MPACMAIDPMTPAIAHGWPCRLRRVSATGHRYNGPAMMDDLADRRFAWPLGARLALALALGLTALGVYSIYLGEHGDSGGLKRTYAQATYTVIGLLAMTVVIGLTHWRFGAYAYALFGATLVLLALLVLARQFPLDPFFPLKRNTARWLVLGPIQLQPSEFAKVTFVLALAEYLKSRSNYRTLQGLIVPFIMTLVPMAMILVEPDLGTSLLLLPTLFLMLFAAGARKRHLVPIILAGAIAAPLFYVSPLMTDYQKKRILALIHQDDPDPVWQMGPGFQLRQSKMAIGSGRWTGQDVEDAAFFRHDLLPEGHNDFIFAVIGHQWGFVGAATLILCYLLLLLCGLGIASSTADPFSRLVAVGVTAIIGVQTVINIGMTIGLMPVTGMTLPFVSAGGSSLIANYIAMGLLISVARRRPIRLAPKPFEFDRTDDRDDPLND